MITPTETTEHLHFPRDGTIILFPSGLAFTAQGHMFTTGTITTGSHFQMCRCARHRGAPPPRPPCFAEAERACLSVLC